MKPFLRAAFHLTPLQALLILFFGAVKYWIVSTGIEKQIKGSFLIVAVSTFFIFLIALGIEGAIENKGKTFESWLQEHPVSGKHMVIGIFVKWARIIPIAIGYLFFAYMITPTSFTLLLALFAGIVIANIVTYVTRKN